MAGIGMYGVYYAKCVKNEGVTIGYSGGVKMLGKAISANFTPNNPEDNPLYANNGVAENDSSSASGGTLDMTLDRLKQDAAADLYGLAVEEVTANVGGTEVTGQALKYRGNEQSAPVGVAFVRMHQQDGMRKHEVVLYRSVTFGMPNEAAQTMGEAIEWQTPELSGVVQGLEGDGSEPWFESVVFPSQEAALEYIYARFKEQPAETRAAGKVSV